jgi:putative transposase
MNVRNVIAGDLADRTQYSVLNFGGELCQYGSVASRSDLTPRIRPIWNTIWTKERGRTMSKSRHTEAQIITALKQVEAGRTAEDVAREQGVSKHTIYAWKAKYGGMDVSEAEEVKHLRDENGRLKKLVADLSLDKDMLQSVIRKNSLGS